jgi:hypothetical protein
MPVAPEKNRRAAIEARTRREDNNMTETHNAKKSSRAPAVTNTGRTLDVIASEILALRRDNLFRIGELLVEAQAACTHGEWGEWLEANDWSWNSADRYMRVAALGTKIPKLKILKLARTTLYLLADEAVCDGDDDPPLYTGLLVDALVKAGAAEKYLSPTEAKRIIDLANLRDLHGDLPDATLWAIDRAAASGARKVERDAVIAALKAQAPTTEEDVKAIIYATFGEVHAREYAEEGDSPTPAPAPTPTLKAYPRLVETNGADPPLTVAVESYGIEVAAPTVPTSVPSDWKMTEAEIAEDIVTRGVKAIEERLGFHLLVVFDDLRKAYEAKEITSPHVLENARHALLDRVEALVLNLLRTEAKPEGNAVDPAASAAAMQAAMAAV